MMQKSIHRTDDEREGRKREEDRRSRENSVTHVMMWMRMSTEDPKSGRVRSTE